MFISTFLNFKDNVHMFTSAIPNIHDGICLFTFYVLNYSIYICKCEDALLWIGVEKYTYSSDQLQHSFLSEPFCFAQKPLCF